MADFVRCDVRNADEIRNVVNYCESKYGRLDILVNNAGVTWSEDIDTFHEKAWDKVMDLDVKSPFFLTQQLLPLIRAAASPDNRASIINVTSVNGIRPSNLRNYSYVAAKAGLGQLSQQLASDLMSDCINVNVIAPGLFKSKMTAPLFTSEDAEAQVMASQPMKRGGAMEDVAGLVIYLSSKAGGFITGVTVPCDGGVTSIN